VPVVIVDANGVLVPLRVLRDRFEGGLGRLLFTSFDCSGNSFLEALSTADELFPVAFVIDPGTVYITDMGASPSSFEIGSVMFRDGQCVTGGNGIGSTGTGRHPLPPIDLTTQYTPPFKVQ
jgi:hypothetical protein